MTATVGILGGSGFVGSSLANHLSKKYRIKVIDIRQTSLHKEDLEFVRADITDVDQLRLALKGVDLVINCAIIELPRINDQKWHGYDVNVTGTRHACEIVARSDSLKGMIQVSSWHVVGEFGLTGVINEEFGFRPDKVEPRASYYALTKVAQETITKLYSSISDKTFGVIRIGTVLGEQMPRETAAQTFISMGLSGEALTPFRHSMHRPMLYVDIKDVCLAFERFIDLALQGQISLPLHNNVVNIYASEPVTIIELAEMIRDLIIEVSNGTITPEIRIMDKGGDSFFASKDKFQFIGDTSKARTLLGFDLRTPQESLREIIKSRMRMRRVGVHRE